MDILVEELKSKAKGPKQDIVEDKFKEFMEEDRHSGKLTIKNIAKSAKSIEYFIECINKMVSYLNIVDKYLDEKQLIAESAEYMSVYQNFVASKTLLKVGEFRLTKR